MTVYVAGRGAVSAFGRGRRALEAGVFSGTRAVRPVHRLRPLARFTSVAAEVESDAPETELALELARVAAAEALAEAGEPNRDRLALVVASTKGDLSGIEGRGDGWGNIQRFAARLGRALSIARSPVAVSCACASGLAAISQAGRMLTHGRAERALVVGADALTPFIVRGFAALLALDPTLCRPFDITRAGINLGDGAGALVLTRERSESLGFELNGWGASNDANHLTGPSRDGGGLALAVERALRQAGIDRADLDYVHLHGTGTEYNDATEARALARSFGERTPPASGTKAQIGHTLGAAGVIESLVTLAALERGLAPGNVGLEITDVDSALDLVTTPRELARARLALKLSAGFGGINTAVVFRATEASR